MNITRMPSKATGFQTFTGMEYVKIDIANQFGLDHENFETRIRWVDDNDHQLDNLVIDADEPALFSKAIRALEDGKAGKPTGYVMGMDACASGVQILSCLTGCLVGATHTGLIDPTQRKDLYSIAVEAMNVYLTEDSQVSFNGDGLNRKGVKNAVMTHFYGSKAQPKQIFGEGSDEYIAFYNSLDDLAPGANMATAMMIGSWQPFDEYHTWIMEDGFNVYIPVIKERVIKVEVDELDHATFSHIIREVEGTESGLSLAANITHSVDGLVVREMQDRCNYVAEAVTAALKVVRNELVDARNITTIRSEVPLADRRKFLATNTCVDITPTAAASMSTVMLERVAIRLSQLVDNRSFPILTIHDEFKAAPNNMNRLRWWYKEILAELADSDMLQDILRQVTRDDSIVIKKLHKDLGSLIRNSNYALS